jgi:hypothetical protein
MRSRPSGQRHQSGVHATAVVSRPTFFFHVPSCRPTEGSTIVSSFLLDTVSARVQDDSGSGSWEDTYTGTFCVENQDEHGFTCSQYVAAGYTCATMMNTFHYDCRCACE